MRITSLLITILFLISAFALSAETNYNSRYGETRFNSLPLSGSVSKTIWVGQWWSYKNSGLAYRFKKGYGDEKYSTPDENTQLSPAEKYDHYVGNQDKLDYDKIQELIGKMDELSGDVNAKVEERRDLVYKLNKMIKENT